MMGPFRSRARRGRWDPRQRVEHEAVQEEKRRLASPSYYQQRLMASSLISIGMAIGVSHWFGHVGALASLSEAVGYPTAVILAAWGSITLTRLRRQHR